ncbi:MAG: hypothetical protein DWQ34_28325 [Planctomycetota bacterium]|nr:MAG: hypothetical protein DWQ34_28325 [Planctomycetota bacterium]REJ90142.1 MAG: hypothetical protein DWQ29_06990 [Planctomycetota bacterium]
MDDDIYFRPVEDGGRPSDPGSVPESLQCLLPLAERIRRPTYDGTQDAFRSASPRDRVTFRRLFKEHREELKSWLDANIERGSPYSAEHIALSALLTLEDIL